LSLRRFSKFKGGIMKRLIIYLKLIFFLPILLIPLSTVMACDVPTGGNDGPTGSSGLDSGSVSQSSGDSDNFDICQFQPFKDSKECKERGGK